MKFLACLLKLSFVCSVLGYVSCAEDKEYDGEGMSPLEVSAYLSSTRSDEGYYSYNTVFYDVRTRHATRVLTLVLPSSEAEARIEAGETYEQIGQEGVPLDEGQLSVCNELDGLSGLFSAGKEPETSYTVIAYAEYADGAVETMARAVVTRVKPPEIFIALLGKWTATMQVKRGDNEEGETIAFPVEIVQGVDDATEATYLSKGRIACLGFGDITYYSPADLRSNKDGRFGNYWNGGLGDASNDYGPKWFLEFVREETDGPTEESLEEETERVIVPAADDAPPLFRYETNLASNCLAGCDGETAVFSEPFQTEISDDRNRIVVKAFEAAGRTYYPSVVVKESEESATVVLLGLSDLVLTRVAEK